MASDPWEAQSASHSVHQRRKSALPPLLLPRHSSGADHFLLLWNGDIIRATKAYARRVGGNDLDAADAAQIVRVRLWKQVNRLSTKPPEYIRVAIANSVENAFRTEKGGLNPTRSRLVPLDDAYPDLHIDRDVVIDVREWIKTLPGSLQQIYDLLYVEGRTERNAAAVMGMTQPHVHQLRDRLLLLGRSALRERAA